MGDNATVWLPEQASTLASSIDSLFYFVYWASIVIFFGTMVAMVYFVYKYRRKSPDDLPPRLKESPVIEIAWIVVPVILVLTAFVWGFRTFIQIGVAPPDAYEIQVTARMWNWQFTYPDDGITTNELHVPVDRPVRLRMSSDDVIHSFFVPEFRVKHDVLPNRYTSVWFEATQTSAEQAGEDGEPVPFTALCTEYCGTQHSRMMADVYVHTQEEFNEWLSTGGGMDEDLPLPELGARLYEQQGCAACHSLDGSATVGPTFQGLFGAERPLASGETVQADENYLRESILEPNARIVEGFQPVMPASYSALSEQQVSALIAFIEEQ